MKNVIIFLSLLIITSCNQAPQSSKKVQAISKTGTEELQEWFGAFTEPYLVGLMDSIKKEYPSLIKDLAFLDSTKGLKIDFIGMVHSTYGNTYQSIDDKTIAICQRSISTVIDTSHYVLIGSEHAFTEAKVTWESFLMENKIDGSEILKLVYGIDTTFTMESTSKNFTSWIKFDHILHRLHSRISKPYIFGVEPKWVWLAQVIIGNGLHPEQLSPETENKLRKLIDVLTRCRSEIAFSRTARQLMKESKGKKAVVVYGKDHLKDFSEMAKKYGTISKFILTKECDLFTQ